MSVRAHPVTLIPGDGIGPEVTEAARRAIEATGAALEWDVQPAGAETLAGEGEPLPSRVIGSVRECGVALKGPLSTPTDGFRSPNLALRRELGLYLGVRPCRALEGVSTPFPQTDLLVMRMLTEDLYAGLEFEPGSAGAERLRELASSAGESLPEDTGFTLKPISRSGALRAARAAFRYAREHGRSRVTAVHKATVMRQSDGIFLEAARETAREHPELPFDERLVDSVCQGLVRQPGDYDVLLMPMLYGDIVSDIGAGLIGGLGVAPGANLGDDYAVFEPVHGTAPRQAGRGRANPAAMILSGAMLLDHLGESEAAGRLVAAVENVVRRGARVTYDLRPQRDDLAVGTAEMATAVIDELSGG